MAPITVKGMACARCVRWGCKPKFQPVVNGKRAKFDQPSSFADSSFPASTSKRKSKWSFMAWQWGRHGPGEFTVLKKKRHVYYMYTTHYTCRNSHVHWKCDIFPQGLLRFMPRTSLRGTRWLPLCPCREWEELAPRHAYTHTDRVHKSETECNATPNWTLQGRRPLKVPEADKMMRVAVLIRKSSCSDSGHVHQWKARAHVKRMSLLDSETYNCAGCSTSSCCM